MWLVAFLTVGAEWFLMWQSHIWNGQEAAFRMFTVVGIILLFPDAAGTINAALRSSQQLFRRISVLM
jgi:predicted small integral membrane protein